MRRRNFIKAFAGSSVAWPLAARAQQPALPVVAIVNGGSLDTSIRLPGAFSHGLNEIGFIEGQNVRLEYHWLDGNYDQVPALLSDLIRHNIAVIATPGSAVASLAAKAATTTIPIVFGVAADPVQLGLVASLARPGGNATGINFFIGEVIAKRLRLLHDLVPKAVRIAVLVNPANPSMAEPTIHDVQEAAPPMGLQIQVVSASTIAELDATFAGFANDRPDALFVAPDGFLRSRRTQLALLTARDRIPAAFANRDYVEVGGLMSYGTDLAEMYRQAGIYTGKILNGDNPATLPVLQSSKFFFVLNRQTARVLGIEIRPDVLSIADEVIE